MGITAENLGEKYGISREACDAYALQSQQRWAAAQAAGAFADELAARQIPCIGCQIGGITGGDSAKGESAHKKSVQKREPHRGGSLQMGRVDK